MSPHVPIFGRVHHFVERHTGHQPGHIREMLQDLGSEHPSLSRVTTIAHRAICRLRGPLADNTNAPAEENQSPEAPLGWTEADREYLRAQSPETLKAAITAIKRVARDVRAREIKERKIQIHVGDLTDPQKETLRHLARTLHRMTGPAVEDADQTDVCAKIIESIIPEIEEMLTKIANEGPLNEENMHEAHEQIQAAIREKETPDGATPTSNEAVIRYALACALLSMQIYNAERIIKERIIDPQASLQTSQNIRAAANALGQFLGYRTGALVRSALGTDQIGTRRGHATDLDTIAEKIREKCPFIWNS